MFKNLKKHGRIFVVGPQRSGTRIVTKMIGNDTGHRVVYEREVLIDSLSKLHAFLKIEKEPLVIHAPGFTRWAHLIATDDDLVVFVWRPLGDIWKSESRIGWEYDTAEAMKYERLSGSAELKQQYWTYQKTKIKNHMTVEYDLLSEHKMWVPKEKREGWDYLRTGN